MDIVLDLLNLITNKEDYQTYIGAIKNIGISSKIIQILEDVEVYYESNVEINWTTFGTWFLVTRHPRMKDEDKELYSTIFSTLTSTPPPSEGVRIDLITSLLNQSYADQIQELASEAVEAPTSSLAEEVTTATSDYHSSLDSLKGIGESIVVASIEEMVEYAKGGDGYEWRLKPFNLSYGPLKVGDHVLLGARPECGKTTFLASEVSYMAPQVPEDKVVVWFNNEEAGKKVKLRIIQAALGWTNESIFKNPAEAMKEYTKLMNGNPDKILVIDNKSLHVRDIERILGKHNAGLIVFDQLRKVNGFEKQSTTEVNRLSKLLGFSRAVAEEAPVIMVHQARGDAHGVMFPGANQLEGSQTEIQGELDLQIMMGRVYDGTPSEKFIRGINICKNKTTGGGRFEEQYRERKWEVEIDPTHARFKVGSM